MTRSEKSVEEKCNIENYKSNTISQTGGSHDLEFDRFGLVTVFQAAVSSKFCHRTWLHELNFKLYNTTRSQKFLPEIWVTGAHYDLCQSPKFETFFFLTLVFYVLFQFPFIESAWRLITCTGIYMCSQFSNFLPTKSSLRYRTTVR